MDVDKEMESRRWERRREEKGDLLTGRIERDGK